jgi:hypothetical protein
MDHDNDDSPRHPFTCPRHKRALEEIGDDNPPRLTFKACPFNDRATWARGIMDIRVAYYGYPFAYMVVNDGVLCDTVVGEDAQWNLSCMKNAQGCVSARVLSVLMERDLRELLHDEIVEGCRQLIRRECPGGLRETMTFAPPQPGCACSSKSFGCPWCNAVYIQHIRSLACPLHKGQGLTTLRCPACGH